LDSEACLEDELDQSYEVERQEKEGQLLLVVGTNDCQVQLQADDADRSDLEGQSSGLVEGFLRPALHRESLDHGELDFVGIVLEANSEVRVSCQGENHAQEEDVVLSLECNDAADGEEDGCEVDLQGVEVAHVGDVEEAEHANHAVGEDH